MTTAMRTGFGAVLGLAAAMAAADVAQAQSSISVEGGAACTTGGRILIESDQVGKGECGWTGAVRYDQGRTPMWLGFDAWGLGARHMSVDQTENAARIDEKRTTLDLDFSRPMGNGLFNLGPTRFLAGVRYTDYDMDLGNAAFTVTGRFRGFGPRAGFMSTILLGRGFQIDSLSSLSVLFGSHDYTQVQAGVQVASQSNDHPVLAYESSLALTYLFAGEHGAKVSAGYRSEYWFNQQNIDASGGFTEERRINRNIGSPFLRVTVPLK